MAMTTAKAKVPPSVAPADAWLVWHAALAYANQWFVTDRQFLAELSPSKDFEVSPEPIGRLAAKYMVARSFQKPKDGHVDRRWEEVALILKETLSNLSGSAPSSAVIHSVGTQLGKVAPTRVGTEMSLISAATKFLWFTGQSKVRILDKRAIAALSQLEPTARIGADYGEYQRVWQTHFAAHEDEVDEALKALPQQLRWTRIPTEFHSEATATFKVAWFKDRVFDKYLWTLGAESGAFE